MPWVTAATENVHQAQGRNLNVSLCFCREDTQLQAQRLGSSAIKTKGTKGGVF